MGPAATIDFMSRVLRASGATRDQDHVRLIVDCNPHVPDRNAARAGDGASPAVVLANMARGLECAGARALAIACNSAHAFADDVRGAVSIPLLDMIGETVDTARRMTPEPKRVGLLAATACLDAELYQTAFARVGMETLVLQGEARERFMRCLYRIKAGAVEPDVRDEMAGLAEELIAKGAEVVISACTEVPLVLGAEDVPAPLVDSTAALVDRTLDFARTGR